MLVLLFLVWCGFDFGPGLGFCFGLGFAFVWLVLSWLGLAWPGLAWLCLAWPGLAWLGLVLLASSMKCLRLGCEFGIQGLGFGFMVLGLSLRFKVWA